MALARRPIASSARRDVASERARPIRPSLSLGLAPFTLVGTLAEFADLLVLLLLVLALIAVACWWSSRMQRLAAEKLSASAARLRLHYDHCPLPTLTWRRVGDDFVLIDHNGAQEG
jgi:hypothetical protein